MTNQVHHIVLVMTSDLTGDQRMRRIARSLHEAGYRVTMIGRAYDGALPLADLPWQQLRINPSRPGGPWMYYDFNRQVRELLPTLGADLYYAVDLDTVLAVSHAARKMAVPWVYDAHEYFTEVPELIGRPLKRQVWRWMRRYVRSAAAAITVNNSLAHILSEVYKRDFAVVRNVPMYHDRVDPPTSQHRRLVYQGAINQGRWVEQYVAMMTSLPPDVSLHLYGDGDKMPEVRQLVASSPRSRDIHLHGKVSPEVLHQESIDGWLGLNLLQIESKSYYYSLANKFFDYMHASLPSINSRLPEYLSIIADHDVGTCVDNKVEALTDAILHYYQSPDLHARQGWAARKAASTYCWQKEEKALLSLIDQQLT